MKIAQHEKKVSGQVLTAEPFIHAAAGTQGWYVEVEDAYNLVQSPVWTFAAE
jgi:hypothetical protein